MLETMTMLYAQRFVAVALSVLALGACDSTGPENGAGFSLSIATPRSTSASTDVLSDILIGTGANSLKLTKVEFVLAETELSKSTTCSGEHDDGCDELELNPILVDLPLDADPPKRVLDVDVPAGTYPGLETQIRPVRMHDDDDEENEHGAVAFLAAHPSWPQGISVRVSGVFTDAGNVQHNFTFTSSAKSKLEMSFESPITVDATTKNVTVTVDVARWFKDGSGRVLDPTLRSNFGIIDANIRRSFKAFKDNNRDCRDDDHEGDG